MSALIIERKKELRVNEVAGDDSNDSSRLAAPFYKPRIHRMGPRPQRRIIFQLPNLQRVRLFQDNRWLCG